MLACLAAIALFADGVVFDSRPLEHTTWNWAFGFRLSNDQFQPMIGLNRQELSNYFYHNFGCAWDPEVFALQQAEYGLIFAKGITLKPHILSFLEGVKDPVLVTSISLEQTLQGLKNSGLENAFAEILTLDQFTQDHFYLTDSQAVGQKLRNLGYCVMVIDDLQNQPIDNQ